MLTMEQLEQLENQLEQVEISHLDMFCWKCKGYGYICTDISDGICFVCNGTGEQL